MFSVPCNSIPCPPLRPPCLSPTKQPIFSIFFVMVVMGRGHRAQGAAPSSAVRHRRQPGEFFLFPPPRLQLLSCHSCRACPPPSRRARARAGTPGKRKKEKPGPDCRGRRRPSCHRNHNGTPTGCIVGSLGRQALARELNTQLQ
jgi:hypothetical protein